jgi:hypothetical protein
MVEFNANQCSFIILGIICAGVTCLCVFVIPKQEVIVIILLSLSLVILFVTLFAFYYFAHEIRRRCCNRKNDPLLDIESQKALEESTTREEIVGQAVNWRVYQGCAKHGANEII